MKKRLYYLLFGIFFKSLICVCYGQALERIDSKLGGIQIFGPASNSINDIMVVGNDVWIATRMGLVRTTNSGESWTLYTKTDGLGRGGVSAFDERNGVIWVATAYDTTTELGTFPAGGGLSYSDDHGETWHWIAQPKDSKEETRYTPMATNMQNLVYDIALTDSAIWIASFLGGLRKSTDMGQSWQVITVDGYPFNPRGPFTHQVFSVIFDGQALWVGTAGGIHKSTDRGKRWVTFNHQNQVEGISGNFVVAIGHQSAGESDLIWAATVEALDSTEYRAVSVTDDGGLTWRVILDGKFSHNFAFDTSNTASYVATDDGLFKSIDFGETWSVFPQIFDEETGEGIYTTDIISVAVGPQNKLWVGSVDGLARSLDDGATWKIFRAFETPSRSGTPETYAYPNPFSPLRDNLIGNDGYVRFQYRTERPTRVTVRVYDFGMNLVRTVTDGKARSFPGDYSEVWDGRNDLGDMVANGVYFYKIDIDENKPLWGKVMVVN